MQPSTVLCTGLFYWHPHRQAAHSPQWKCFLAVGKTNKQTNKTTTKKRSVMCFNGLQAVWNKGMGSLGQRLTWAWWLQATPGPPLLMAAQEWCHWDSKDCCTNSLTCVCRVWQWTFQQRASIYLVLMRWHSDASKFHTASWREPCVNCTKKSKAPPLSTLLQHVSSG